MAKEAAMGAPAPESGEKSVLNNQEREVVALVMQGLEDHQIADRVSITEQAVKEHIKNIFNKLGVRDRLELVFYVLDKNKRPIRRDVLKQPQC